LDCDIDLVVAIQTSLMLTWQLTTKQTNVTSKAAIMLQVLIAGSNLLTKQVYNQLEGTC